MRDADQTLLAAFTRNVDRIAGKAQLQITAGETGLPEDVLEKVESLSEVGEDAPLIEATIDGVTRS